MMRSATVSISDHCVDILLKVLHVLPGIIVVLVGKHGIRPAFGMKSILLHIHGTSEMTLAEMHDNRLFY